ncbi:hypothetical protein [Ruania zhangjianzhongii]|uniref:hypothetical protein n=1 Tax=Ruania zhangjianzhongii TaxID=2603206 RepID=UPI0011CA3365|nr:hypothetical protein [Ruania zhangjianzhongii]
MSARRDSQPGSAIQIIAPAAVGIGCGIAMSELTEWQWWIRYPLILVAVFVAALLVQGLRERRTRTRS